MQLFSEYVSWVRNRAGETHGWWAMRGWLMPGFTWLDDARYPRHKDAQMKLLDMITEYMKAEQGTVISMRARTIGTNATASTSTRRTSSSISPTGC